MTSFHHITGSNIESDDPKLNPRTGRGLTDFCIVLDLDATLISTVNPVGVCELSRMSCDKLRKTLGSDRYYEFRLDPDEKVWGFIRPHAIEFLDFCDKYFDRVIVYTAGTQDYGHAIVSEIFGRTASRYRPDLILTRPECLLLDDDMFTIKGVRKPLKMVIPDYDPSKYVLIDDRMSNIRFNPRNGIIIPPYNPNTIREIYDDGCLSMLQEWFNRPTTTTTTDIRDLEKMTIFINGYDMEPDYF